MAQTRFPASSKSSAKPFAVVVLPLPVLPRMAMWCDSASAGKAAALASAARRVPRALVMVPAPQPLRVQPVVRRLGRTQPDQFLLHRGEVVQPHHPVMRGGHVAVVGDLVEN